MLDFTRLMLISTQVEVVVEVGVELGNKEKDKSKTTVDICDNIWWHLSLPEYCTAA